jgi:hypothetical protein
VYWRIMKMPNPVTRNGTITDCRWLCQPNLIIMRYSGMMPSCTGTIMLPRMNSSSAFFPWKRSLANAKPASEAKNTVDSVTQLDTMIELSRPVPMLASALAHTLDRLAKKLPPGTRGGGTALIASLVRVAPTSMK